MTYRVSTWPDGHRTWWIKRDPIPADHTAIREATTEESAVIDRIMAHTRAGRMPPRPQ